LLPPSVTLEMFRAAVFTFVSVLVTGGLWTLIVVFPNANPVGLKLTAVPVPLKFTTLGLLGSESVMVKVPVWVPVADGVKAVAITQLAPPDNVAPHVEPGAYELNWALE
jgi:hypothetical protein